jgi:O-antigen ligase
MPAATGEAVRPSATLAPKVSQPAAPLHANDKPGARLESVGEVPSPIHTVGIWALCLSILAPFVNDWLRHLFGGTASLYYVGFPVSIVVLLVCGTAFRAGRTKAGKLWIVLLVWMVLCIPSSVWPGGSVEVLKSYIPRAHLMFFMICAFALTLRQCRTLMYANIAGGFIMLLTCIVFGGLQVETGRFCILGSLYYENPNDLALQLVVFIGCFAFLLFNRSWVLRALGGSAIILTAWFLLKTASRGAFVACMVLLVIAFIFTKSKLKMILLILPIALLIPLVSTDVLHRLVLIVASPETEPIHSESESEDIGSQTERQHLLWLSIQTTLKHPIFGVGPGMFIEATSGLDQKHGIHSPALGTHNAYTQVSSECGIPGLVFFLGVIVISIRKMLKLYKQTTGIPELSDISSLAYSVFLSCVGFAVAAFFYHVTYTGFVSLFAGMAMAIWMASEPVLRSHANLQPAALQSGTQASGTRGVEPNGYGMPSVGPTPYGVRKRLFGEPRPASRPQS